ncbi:histidine-containing phosphotransfer protein 4-like [Alnus glutinosa]|uniref:histidine-containing phosphotransfer protein 4-like n=1 Tax=Alnus glutinosa TaxID=3517 RepID=UPI002D774173|nr:histidine-containing phosphotransfer protein 4-like [Alnus glutinosa]
MPGKSLKQQVAAFRQSLFCEEILNGQFTCLEELEGEDNPNFIETIVNMYLNESPKYIDTIEQTLEATPIDVANLERCLYKFKGSSSSIGANKVTIEITKMLNCCISGDIEG